MGLIERYIFGKVLRAFLLAVVTLSVTVWLTQALRQFDLVSALGQSLGTFFQISLLLLPALATVVAPIALLLAVMYTFSSLNDGSELVVMNASGARQWMMLKPVLLVALIALTFLTAMSLYFSPLSMRVWREMITNVRGSVITSVLREGEFMKLADGLIFQLRGRSSDGGMQGIFLSDTREKDETITYLAQQGAVVDTPLGVLLVMRDGTIQRQRKSDNSIAIIQFTSYAFDLSSFSSRAETRSYRPAERPTSYLFNPDPDDRLFQQHPEKYRAEIYTRFSTPLNALVFAIVPLAFLAQAESNRRGRAPTMFMAVTATVIVAVLEFVLGGAAEDSTIAAIALFAVPIIATGTAIALILLGKQPKPPEAALAFMDRISSRAQNLMRRPGTVVATNAPQ